MLKAANLTGSQIQAYCRQGLDALKATVHPARLLSARTEPGYLRGTHAVLRFASVADRDSAIAAGRFLLPTPMGWQPIEASVSLSVPPGTEETFFVGGLDVGPMVYADRFGGLKGAEATLDQALRGIEPTLNLEYHYGTAGAEPIRVTNAVGPCQVGLAWRKSNSLGMAAIVTTVDEAVKTVFRRIKNLSALERVTGRDVLA